LSGRGPATKRGRRRWSERVVRVGSGPGKPLHLIDLGEKNDSVGGAGRGPRKSLGEGGLSTREKSVPSLPCSEDSPRLNHVI